MCEWAWPYASALRVVTFLSGNGYLVLGGDVLRTSPLEHTLDNWHYDYDEVKASRDQAVEYIKRYHRRWGDAYLYVIVFRKASSSRSLENS